MSLEQNTNGEWTTWMTGLEYARAIILAGVARRQGRTVRVVNSKGTVVA